MLTVVEGRLINEENPYVKMEPYVVLQVDAQTYRTDPQRQGGANPKWHKEFKIAI